jgi:hypothetical protein
MTDKPEPFSPIHSPNEPPPPHPDQPQPKVENPDPKPAAPDPVTGRPASEKAPETPPPAPRAAHEKHEAHDQAADPDELEDEIDAAADDDDFKSTHRSKPALPRHKTKR